MDSYLLANNNAYPYIVLSEDTVYAFH